MSNTMWPFEADRGSAKAQLMDGTDGHQSGPPLSVCTFHDGGGGGSPAQADRTGAGHSGDKSWASVVLLPF